MEAEGDHIRRFNYTGGRVPHDVTHVTIDASVRVIRRLAFSRNPSIVEVIFDVNVTKVEEDAFADCPSLRRVIMPGVEVVERYAFMNCRALTDVECGKLERIKANAFKNCKSLMRIGLPSAKIVDGYAFYFCKALLEATFGSELEIIGYGAFMDCPSLERITIPLKDGIITHDHIFTECNNLKHVDLVEGEVHETIAALQLEEWRNDMYEEINSINQILPTVSAGFSGDRAGGKARAIRTWIRSVLRKIVHYQAEHQRLLNEEVATALEHVATALQLALPQDIVMDNVLPFLELPSYTFEV